jgi:NAD(P)-dependent dehydrogenase (short-subunit alcohol dehydrogenase family)
VTRETDGPFPKGELRFDGRVAVVTGAARSIGRAYALLLAARGAKVLVNDLGIETDGSGASMAPAEAVVAEIRALGGIAEANCDTVATEAGAQAIIAHAENRLGPVDVLVHNAGFNQGPFEALLDVHLRAAYWLTEAVWPSMVKRRYGRVLLTTSAAGLYGSGDGPDFNPKQNYATAKMGLVGIGKALAARGRPANIMVNLVSPTSQSRLQDANRGVGSSRPEAGTASLDAMIEWVKTFAPPEMVAAGVLWLLHEACPVTSEVFTAGGGRVGNVFTGVTRGYWNPALTPEDPLRNLDKILDRTDSFVPADMSDYAAWQRNLMAERRRQAGLSDGGTAATQPQKEPQP